MKLMRFSVVFCLLALVAACQTVPIAEEQDLGLEKGKLYQPGSENFKEQQEHIQQLTDWQVNGVFSYSDNEENAANGKILWQVSRSEESTLKSQSVQEKIRLVGPVGAGAVELIVDQQQAMLVSGKQRLVDPSGNVEALLFRAVGWRLPISEMRYWLFGMPAPALAGRYWLDSNGDIDRLQQSGWDITFSKQQPFVQNNSKLLRQHPRKVFAENEKNGIKVRLVAKQVSLL